MKQAVKNLFVVNVVFALATVVSPFLTGPSSIFTSATSGQARATVGLNCWRETPTTDTLKARFSVYENDPEFRIDDNGPNNGTLVTYNCYHLNTAAYRGGSRSYEFASGCNLTRLDSSFGSGNTGPSGDDVDERTLAVTHDISVTGTPPCGGEQSGLDFTFIVTCQRQVGFHRHFDFDVQYQCNNGTALITQLTNSTEVSDPPVRNTTIRNKVTMKCYHVKSPSTKPDFSKEMAVEDAGLELPPAGGLELGAPMFCEWCIAIDTASGDRRTHFTPNVDAMGIWIESLTFRNIDSVNPVVSGFPKEVIVARKNCGLGLNPAPQLFNHTTNVSIHYRQPTGVTKHTLTSPNCFITDTFEIASYVTQQVTSLSGMEVEAELRYVTTDATTTGVNNAFGDLSTADPNDGYHNCTLVNRRRRESDELVERLELPKTMKTIIYLRPDPNSEDEPIATNKPSDAPCFEKLTFSVLTASLSFLFAIVIMMAVFLACKIESTRRDEKGSMNSQSSFSNKGFY